MKRVADGGLMPRTSRSSARAKSELWVRVQSEVPSPGDNPPARPDAADQSRYRDRPTIHRQRNHGLAIGERRRTMVTGNASSRSAAINSSSQAILLRGVFPNGLARGVGLRHQVIRDRLLIRAWPN